MAEKMIIYWRDIPAQVVVKQGRKKVKRELPDRFAKAIDAAAMKAGLDDTDSYLSEWRKGPFEPCDDDMEAVADQTMDAITEEYTMEKLKTLISSGGVNA